MAGHLGRTARFPFRILVTVTALAIAVRSGAPWSGSDDVGRTVNLGMRVLIIVSAAWLVAAIVLALEDLGLRRYRLDVPDNLAARRARTQAGVIRRLTLVIIVVLAVGAVSAELSRGSARSAPVSSPPRA